MGAALATLGDSLAADGRIAAMGPNFRYCPVSALSGPARAGAVMAPAAYATLRVCGKLMNGIRAHPAGAGARYAADEYVHSGQKCKYLRTPA